MLAPLIHIADDQEHQWQILIAAVGEALGSMRASCEAWHRTLGGRGPFWECYQ